MKIIYKIIAFACSVASIYVLFAATVHAETRLPNVYLETNATWEKGGNPYIVSDQLRIPEGVMLTIGEGVEVRGDTSDPEIIPSINVLGGTLDVKGGRRDRVSFKNISNITVDKGIFSVERADFEHIYEIKLRNSTSTFATSTFTNFDSGINIFRGQTGIWGSKINNMDTAFSVKDKTGPIFQVGSGIGENAGGIGNALAHEATVPLLRISNSSIVNNIVAIDNISTTTLEARDNWWGIAAGPRFDGYDNSVNGSVMVSPWLVAEPEFDPEENNKVCCSSVLFIPGLEGSAMFRSERRPFGLGTSTNTLWVANRNNDIRKLYLRPNGSSTDPNIYSGKPIGKVFGVHDIYDGFLSFMDGIKNRGLINEWRAYGYDWRKFIGDVALSPEKKSTTTESLIETVVDLASRSRTGKVSIVAHSNGGLVAKYLAKALSDAGRANLIDKVISVAVPYLGTPEALLGLLHGDGQELGYGIIVKAGVMRQLGLNMPSAYSLLPAAKYFEKALGPTIVFATTSTPGINNGIHPKSIETIVDQTSFLTDAFNVRINPPEENTRAPAKGNNFLSASAYVLHGLLDPMEWPREIVRYALVGWNKETTKAVKYAPDGSHSPEKTNMGDGTVVTPSAAYNAGTVGAVDLNVQSKIDGSDISHARILESTNVQKGIEAALLDDGSDWCTDISGLQGVSCGEPPYTGTKGLATFVLETHSPVELHVYDESGRHTGIIPPPPELVEETLAEGGGLDDMVQLYENKIVNSNFSLNTNEDVGGETRISIPDDGRKYRVEIRGIGIGTFDYDMTRYSGSVATGRVEYKNIPVTPLMTASTTIFYPQSMATGTTALQIFASSTLPLQVDYDGDGRTDMKVETGKSLGGADYLEALQKVIGRFEDRSDRKSKITKRIEQLLKRFRDVKSNKDEDRHRNNLAHQRIMKHVKIRELSSREKTDLMDDVEDAIQLMTNP